MALQSCSFGRDKQCNNWHFTTESNKAQKYFILLTLLSLIVQRGLFVLSLFYLILLSVGCWVSQKTQRPSFPKLWKVAERKSLWDSLEKLLKRFGLEWEELCLMQNTTRYAVYAFIFPSALRRGTSKNPVICIIFNAVHVFQRRQQPDWTTYASFAFARTKVKLLVWVSFPINGHIWAYM